MNIKKDNFFGYLFILPFLILFFSFLIYPFGKLFYMSLFEWNLMAVAMNPDNAIYVGFENFYYLLAGEGIWFNFFVFFTPIKILTFIILTVFLYFLYTREILKHNFGLIFFFIYAYVVYFVHGIQPTEDAYWEDDVFWKSIRNTMVMDFFSAYSITFIALLIAITSSTTLTSLVTAFLLKSRSISLNFLEFLVLLLCICESYAITVIFITLY